MTRSRVRRLTYTAVGVVVSYAVAVGLVLLFESVSGILIGPVAGGFAAGWLAGGDTSTSMVEGAVTGVVAGVPVALLFPVAFATSSVVDPVPLSLEVFSILLTPFGLVLFGVLLAVVTVAGAGGGILAGLVSHSRE